MYYGITRQQQVFDIVDDVIEVLGGSNNVKMIMLETAAQETHLGTLRDPTPYGAGTGIGQADELPFYDMMRRTRARHVETIQEAFGIEMYDVEWRELECSPLLSFLTMRLHYKLIPDLIPGTVEARAAYWKRFYNTFAGKGTVEDYIKNAKRV